MVGPRRGVGMPTLRAARAQGGAPTHRAVPCCVQLVYITSCRHRRAQGATQGLYAAAGAAGGEQGGDAGPRDRLRDGE